MKPSFFLKTFLPVFAAIILVAGIAYAVWTEPTAAPPGDNVAAPINTSSTAQAKAGGFTAETLTAATVKGTKFCLGASCITAWPSGGGGGYVPPACECFVNSNWDIALDSGWYPCGTAYDTCPGCYYCSSSSNYTCIGGSWVYTGDVSCGCCAI